MSTAIHPMEVFENATAREWWQRALVASNTLKILVGSGKLTTEDVHVAATLASIQLEMRHGDDFPE